MDVISSLLVELRSDPRFAVLAERIERSRPQIPVWTPGMTPEEWMYQSSMRRGFDLAASFLGLNFGDDNGRQGDRDA